LKDMHLHYSGNASNLKVELTYYKRAKNSIEIM
jgi:hypothetical protein